MANSSQTTSLYIYRDLANIVLYVGITDRRGQRALEHAMAAEWWPQVMSGEFRHYPDRESAHRAEADAVRELRPMFIRQLNPDAEPLRGIYGAMLAGGGIGLTTAHVAVAGTSDGEVAEFPVSGLERDAWISLARMSGQGEHHRIRTDLGTACSAMELSEDVAVLRFNVAPPKSTAVLHAARSRNNKFGSWRVRFDPTGTLAC